MNTSPKVDRALHGKFFAFVFNYFDKNKMKLSLLKCLRKWRTTIVCLSEIGNVKQEPEKASASALAGYSYKGYHSIKRRPTSVPILQSNQVKRTPPRFYQWIDYLKNEPFSRSGNWRQIQSGISACVMSSEHFTRTSLYLVRLEIFEWISFLEDIYINFRKMAASSAGFPKAKWG